MLCRWWWLTTARMTWSLLMCPAVHAVQVVVVDHSAHGVDLPEDVASIEQLLKQRLGVE